MVDQRSARLTSLRQQMQQHQLDAWIIPSSDAHNSEYVADYWSGRVWLSGFTGSAGTLVITQDQAALWVDGRYFIQGVEQLMGTEITLMKQGLPEIPEKGEWLTEVLKAGSRVGFDSAALSLSQTRALEKELQAQQITLMPHEDLLNAIWSDRPAIPAQPVFLHQPQYTGKSCTEKLTEVRDLMAAQKATYLLIPSLDDIAWLLNLRGSDIACNPVFLAFVLISPESCTIFTNQARIEEEAMQALVQSGIQLQGYEEITAALAELPADGQLWINPDYTNSQLAAAIPAELSLIEQRLPTTTLKAVKNETEIACMVDCHQRDGMAMVKFLAWLDKTIPSGTLNEVNIDTHLCALRAESPLFKGVSFPSIVGYAEHGAICHYRATDESALSVQPKGLLLVDSGAQYPDGTTDITRTIACGELTQEEMRDYTLVLKSHIALASARFKKGTKGIQLDAITRQPLWTEGIDFNHGTGHGVGYFLNVHEGPQSISPRWFDVVLEAGMLVTNEPGIYRDHKHGIRIENIMLIEEDISNEFGTFLKLTPLTLTPIDTRPLLIDLLTTQETSWLNDYHRRVFDALSTQLQGEELAWLTQVTQAL